MYDDDQQHLIEKKKKSTQKNNKRFNFKVFPRTSEGEANATKKIK